MWILQLLNDPTSLWPAGYIGAGYAPYEGVLLMGEWVGTHIWPEHLPLVSHDVGHSSLEEGALVSS